MMAEVLASCGCAVTWRKDKPLQSELIYCPKHAAADAMYEALKNLVMDCLSGNPVDIFVNEGLAAIALADDDRSE